MDFDIASPIRSALERAVDDGDLGYAAPTDLPAAFAAFAEQYLDWNVDEAHVFAVPDVMSGVTQALHLFTQSGDGIVINPPVYPPFFEVIRYEGRHVVEVPLSPDETVGWTIDLDELERAFANGARAYLLCSPHNPVGRVWSAAELGAIAQRAQRYDVAVIADEIHAPLTMPGVRFVPYLQVASDSSRAVALASASKGWNIPGLKCAVLVAGTAVSERVRAQLAAIPTEIESRIGQLGVIATVAAFRDGGPWLEDLRTYLDGNRMLLEGLLGGELRAIRYRPPEATYLAWLDCRALELGDAPWEYFLEHGRVALYRGVAFGRQGIGYVRVNMGTSRAILTDIVDRMERALHYSSSGLPDESGSSKKSAAGRAAGIFSKLRGRC
ncbi:MAG: aminotransferase class I/II-fold pyridoxal phosphate-dependent enzyme [Candidatus Eremiobacteraeota bacterium]|nr:aminotransferase class I/II-fold pyridoxal phosphate-dependent enzyme [Candidatus Eremiobacteraeota bacterium]